MLGSAADAEEVEQETWLRWDGIGGPGRDEVRDPRSYLVRIVTRQAINRLRTLARRREDYVGEWLLEPLLTSPLTRLRPMLQDPSTASREPEAAGSYSPIS